MENMQDLLRSAHMTKTQKIIAEYILDNASDACFMTSTEIALKLGVSESSVIRFSRTIGFSAGTALKPTNRLIIIMTAFNPLP